MSPLRRIRRRSFLAAAASLPLSCAERVGRPRATVGCESDLDAWHPSKDEPFGGEEVLAFVPSTTAISDRERATVTAFGTALTRDNRGHRRARAVALGDLPELCKGWSTGAPPLHVASAVPVSDSSWGFKDIAGTGLIQTTVGGVASDDWVTGWGEAWLEPHTLVVRRYGDYAAQGAIEPRRERARCRVMPRQVDPLVVDSPAHPRCQEPGEDEPPGRVVCDPLSAEGERIDAEYRAAFEQCFHLSFEIGAVRDILGAGFVRRGDTRLLVASESELHAVDLDVVRRHTVPRQEPLTEELVVTPSPSGGHAWTTPLAGRYLSGETWSGDYGVRIALVVEDDDGLALLYGETDGRAEPPAWTTLPLPRRSLVHGVRPAMAWRAGAMRVALLLRSDNGCELLEWAPLARELDRQTFWPPARPTGGCVAYAWLRGGGSLGALGAVACDDGGAYAARARRGMVWLRDCSPWTGLAPPSLVPLRDDVYVVSVEGRRGIRLTSVSESPAYGT